MAFSIFKEKHFLSSKVARRIFFLFILCALLPITALAVITFTEVKEHLDNQMRKKIADETKLYSLVFYDHLIRIEEELRFLASNFRDFGTDPSAHQPKTPFHEYLKVHLKNVAIVGAKGMTQIIGAIPWDRDLTSDEERHLQSGKALVLTLPSPSGNTRIYMAILIDPEDPEKVLLLSEIDQGSLWRLQGKNSISRSYNGTLCVLNDENKVIYSDHPVSSAYIDRSVVEVEKSSAGWFYWKEGSEAFLTAYWSIPLKYRFLHAYWVVSQRVSVENLFAPVLLFTKIFVFVFFLSILIVVFLTITQIRRTMNPLEKLHEGTQRIAEGNFTARIDFNSGDEFEQVAHSFNEMSTRLGRQFTALKTMTEIGEGILSNLDMDKIAQTVVNRVPELIQCDFLAFTHLPNDGEILAVTYVRKASGTEVIKISHEGVSRHDLEEALKGRSMANLGKWDPKPSYLQSLAEAAPARMVLLPLFREGNLTDIMALGLGNSHFHSLEESHQLLQIAEQVKVALANASLVNRLADLNLGTLIALARTVDAKSPWTAGHSERVTQVAMNIGHAMNLPGERLNMLNRGALLHDIGKIGISAKILDKPTRLTDEEFSLIKEHPTKGFRIIEPIAAYKDVLPIILQHHERIDGKGYPQGLEGHEISMEAKIVAVADAYDAIVSDRPYRKGLSQPRAMEIMREEAGQQFDPSALEAFIEVFKEGESSSGATSIEHPMEIKAVSGEERISDARR